MASRGLEKTVWELLPALRERNGGTVSAKDVVDELYQRGVSCTFPEVHDVLVTLLGEPIPPEEL